MSQSALVEAHYGDYARSAILPGKAAHNTHVATVLGYTPEELQGIPENANLGLSSGKPLATANLKEVCHSDGQETLNWKTFKGETLVDLGSGGGLDVFVASRTVGPTGKSIGIDMTDDMLELARRNATEGGYTNVEFVG